MDPAKRWMTLARPEGTSWMLSAPEKVGPLDTWMSRLRNIARKSGAQGDARIALGVDFPLGLPRAYAEAHADSADFPAFLRALVARPGFFKVCATLEEISADRPFYPARGIAGMTRASHAAALQLGGPTGLSRICDRATLSRPAGAPLFWTLGANQTGKAAITAWRDWLLPALAAPDPPRLWPFEGDLHDLLALGGIVVAETYPAEAMRQLGLRMGGSKRRQSDRANLADPLLRVMASLDALPTSDMQTQLAQGFGADATGEDRFDSVLGVLCLLAVLSGRQPDFIPDDPWVRNWEGWVLGQTSLPAMSQPS